MTQAKCCASVAAVLAAYTALACGPVRAQEAAGAANFVDLRDFSISPKVGIQESYTDNAFLTSTNVKDDLVTRLNLTTDINVNTGRTKASIDTAFSYDIYAQNGSLSGWSLYGNGNGTYTVIPGFLTLEGEGSVTNGSVSTFGTSAIDRAGTIGRVQLATYDFGPRITTTLDDFADINLLGRFAQVLYNAEDTSDVAVLPADSSIFEFTGTAGTADRFTGIELTTATNYERDDHSFQMYNGMQSVFVRIMPQVRLIARGGYEDISQPAVVDIAAPIASGGVEVAINQLSKITVEAGTRYNRATYDANIFLQFSDRFYATGRYFEVLEPAQIQINSTYSDFVNMSRLLPTPLVPTNFGFTGNLYNQTSLNKTAEGHLVYKWEDDLIDLDASWNDRLFVAMGDHDRVLVGNASYSRRIAPDLGAQIRFSYAQTFASPIYGASSSYGGEINASYDLNSVMTARIGYALEKQTQTSPIHDSLSENVVFAAVERRF